MASGRGTSGEQGLWSRTFIVLMGVNFCSALSFYLVMVKITEFAMDTYGVIHSIAGTLMSSYVIAALLTRLFFGSKIDSWGVKRALVIGSVVNAACMALYLVPLPFIPLIAVRVVHGFGFAIMSGSAAAGAALVIPRHRYGEGIGYFSMMQALATGVGPFVAIAITNTFGSYRAMFIVATVFAVLAVASLALLDIPAQASKESATGGGVQAQASDGGAAAQEAQAKNSAAADGDSAAATAITASTADSVDGENDTAATTAASPSKKSFVQWAVVPLASVLFLCYIGYAGVISFVTLYAAHLHLVDAVTLYFVVYAVVILVTRPPVGRLVDRKGENAIIYWCFLSLAVGFVVLALASNAFMLLASAAFIGFGIGATQSITQAVIARDTPPAEMGRANSTFFMSMDLGSGVGPIVIGAVIPFIGYSGSYLMLAGVAVLAGVVYHLVHGRKQKKSSITT